MAAAVDFDLGTVNLGGSSATRALTTSHLASSGTRIVLLISYWTGGAGTTTVAGGGLTWHQDKHVANGSDMFDIFSAPAVSGLASSTAITATISANTFSGTLISCVSISGVDMTQGAGIDATGSATGTGVNWSSGVVNAVAGGISVGGSGNEDATTSTLSVTPIATGTVLHNVYNVADQQGMVTGTLVVGAGAAGAVTGTWTNSASTANTGALVIYAGTGGAVSGIPDLIMAPPHR